MARVSLRAGILFRTVLLSVFSFGCQSGGNQSSAATKIDTLDSGVILVSNTGTANWEPREEWTVEELFRLGSVHEEGPELFGSVRGLEVDSRGRIWVFDGQAYDFRIFDEYGRHVRTFGRRGGGPEEFSQIFGFAFAPNDSLWVFDPGNLRVSVFDSAGSLAASHSTNLQYTYFPWGGTIDSDGYIYKRERVGPFPSQEFVVVRYDRSFSPVDSLPGPAHPEGSQRWLHQQDGGITGIRIPFSGDVIWRVTKDGGMWVAVTDQYRLIRLDRNADTLRVGTKSFDPIPVMGHEVDSVFAELTRFGDTPQRSDVPGFKPPVRGFWVDDRNNLWVLLLADGPGEGRRVEVFDSLGAYLGPVTLPFQASLYPSPVIRNDMITAVTTDSLGVRYVVRAQINKPGDR